MKPYYSDDLVTLHHGDCLDVLRSLPDASVDAVVTDPPYGLGFMGKEWDGLPPGLPFAAECLRVLKPGGHMLAFGGTRTWHRLACAVEDAGLEVRDSIAWLYGQGFPKSLDVSKAIDKEVIGRTMRPDGTTRDPSRGGKGGGSALLGSVDGTLNVNGAMADITAPATPDAERWQGWGTALKPAFEPIVVARKPLSGTVSANVLAHGTGALNIDGCRVGTSEELRRLQSKTAMFAEESRPWKDRIDQDDRKLIGSESGRWPANVVLDESQAAALDEQSGEVGGSGGTFRDVTRSALNASQDGSLAQPQTPSDYGKADGASRFMYVAKADASERVRVDGIAHPTVKPLALMRWLVRLVTPPGGVVLEPFAGSGTTVEACILEGFQCIAIEREADYLPLITQRIHRRRDPVAAVKASGDDGGLFDLLGEASA